MSSSLLPVSTLISPGRLVSKSPFGVARVKEVCSSPDTVGSGGAVIDLFEERDFSDGGRGHTFGLVLEPDLLERHDLAIVLEVASLVHHTVRACQYEKLCQQESCKLERDMDSLTFADLFNLLVSIHGDLVFARSSGWLIVC